MRFSKPVRPEVCRGIPLFLRGFSFSTLMDWMIQNTVESEAKVTVEPITRFSGGQTSPAAIRRRFSELFHAIVSTRLLKMHRREHGLRVF